NFYPQPLIIENRGLASGDVDVGEKTREATPWDCRREREIERGLECCGDGRLCCKSSERLLGVKS
ncbi:Hypothetical predicted protein, partial [Olea europaea subsp. europaea]